MNILIISHNLNFVCGVTNYIFNLVFELKKIKEITKIIIVTPGGDAVDRFKKLKCELIEYKYLNHDIRSPQNFLRSVLKLRSIFKNENVSIIHSNNHYVSNICKISKIGLDIPLIETVHGIIPSKGILPHYIADYFIAVNKHIYRFLKERKNNAKVSLIFAGIIVPKGILVKPRIKATEVLISSRLVEEKGVKEIIIGLSKLSKFILENIRITILGEGEQKKELILLAKKKKLTCVFPNVTPFIEKYYYKADIFLFNSKTAEGFPTALLYAAAYKNLVITSNFLGLNEIFVNNEDGFIFKNDSEFIKIFSEIIKDFIHTNEVINNFYTKVKINHSSKVNSSKVYMLYLEALKNLKS